MKTSRIVDLSHLITTGMPVYPGDPETCLTPFCTPEGFRLTTVSFGTHTGTHLDAPAHLIPDGVTVENVPLEKCFGPACVIRIPKGQGDEITATELEPFGKQIQPGTRILIQTGWSESWNTPDYFDRPPVLAPDAVEALAQSGIALLGMDGPDVARRERPAHERLLRCGIILLENLTNLHLCPDRFTLCALPLPIEGGDGAPVRAVAITSESPAV